MKLDFKFGMRKRRRIHQHGFKSRHSSTGGLGGGGGGTVGGAIAEYANEEHMSEALLDGNAPEDDIDYAKNDTELKGTHTGKGPYIHTHTHTSSSLSCSQGTSMVRYPGMRRTLPYSLQRTLCQCSAFKRCAPRSCAFTPSPMCSIWYAISNCPTNKGILVC